MLPAITTVVVPPAEAAGPPPPPAITQVPLTPGQRYGGRAVAVDVNPFDKTRAVSAAEDGGLWRTSDTGATWSRIDNFPQFRMSDVSYDPGDPNVIVTTTRFDGRTTAQSGVWRTADGGSTWARAGVPFTCTTTPNADDIAVVPGGDVHQKMFVATDCGVAYSNDSGATWTSADPTGGGGTGISDVVAARTGADAVVAYACTGGAVYRTTVTGGAQPAWALAGSFTTNTGCDLAISPLRTSVVLLSSVDGAGAGRRWRLFESDDSAATFQPLFPLSDNSLIAGNGRPAPVFTHRATDGDATHFDVYWVNTVVMLRQHCTDDGNPATPDCPVNAETGGQCANAVDDDGDQIVNEGCPVAGATPPGAENAGAVPGQCKNTTDDDGDGAVNDGCSKMEFFLNGTHVDVTGIAFDPTVPGGTGCPMFDSSDGGIGRSTDCGLSWADSNAGRDALQIQNVWGTVRGPGAGELDLAFGTQDNDFYYTLDNGVGWTEAACCEGFVGQSDHRVPPGGVGDIRYTFVDCFGCGNVLTGRGFGQPPNPGNVVNISDLGWPDPPGGGWGIGGAPSVPILFGNQRWAQVASDLAGSPNFQVYVMQPETGSQCANATDDDFDTGFQNAGAGAVNDGCPAVGAPETGNNCHNATDDDGDTVVNDGCSHIASAESGSECADGVDSDGDGVVNDACPAQGPDADGDGKLDPETGAQCLDTTDNDADGSVNDGCPQVGVWAPMGPSFTQAPLAIMQAAGPASGPTLYFPVATGSGQRLRKLAGPLNSSAILSNASGAGATLLGNVAQRGTAFIGTNVFAVAPSDPLRLYAADNTGQKMRFSTDGGATWQADDELTSLVTNNGEFRWTGAGGSAAWTIAYDPEDANKIMVGTEFAGIFASLNGGQDWFNIRGSTKFVPQVSGFFFDEDHNKVYASSYGRSLWTISLPSADLSVTKTSSPDPVIAGNELYYTITATNNGPDPATAEVVDTLPAEVTYVTNDLAPPAGCTEGPTGTVRCQLGVLASGESTSFRIKVAVKPDAVVATGPKSITNTVRIQSSDTADPDPSDNTATETTIVEDSADLAVTKLCKPDTTVRAGQPVACTVFVDNAGPSYARGVVVDDTMLSSGTFTVSDVVPALSPGTPGCTLASVTGGQRLTCRLGPLANASTSSTGRATMTYTINATEGQDINNVARVRSDTPDPNPDNNQATVSITVTSVSDLSLVKSASASSVVAGTDLTYTLTATNSGPSTAEGVVIADSLPAAVQVVSVTGSGGATCNAGVPGDPLSPTTCSFGTVAPAGARTMTIVVHVRPDTVGTIQNDARVSSSTFDDDLSDNLATVSTTVTADADLSLTKVASPTTVLAGDKLTYTMTVTNLGPSTAKDVKVSDQLPAGTSYVSGVDGNGVAVCALVQPGSVTCDLGTMGPGATRTVILTVLVAPSVPKGTVLTNAAHVSSATPDSHPANNDATAPATVDTRAELWLDKTASQRSGNPSPIITYTLIVHNDRGCESDAQSSATPTCGAGGPSDAQRVTVSDTLPLDAKKIVVQYVSPLCTYAKATHTVSCSSETVPAGASVSFVIEAQANGSVGTITNTATLTSATADPVSANNTNSATLVMKGGTGKR